MAADQFTLDVLCCIFSILGHPLISYRLYYITNYPRPCTYDMHMPWYIHWNNDLRAMTCKACHGHILWHYDMQILRPWSYDLSILELVTCICLNSDVETRNCRYMSWIYLDNMTLNTSPAYVWAQTLKPWSKYDWTQTLTPWSVYAWTRTLKPWPAPAETQILRSWPAIVISVLETLMPWPAQACCEHRPWDHDIYIHRPWTQDLTCTHQNKNLHTWTCIRLNTNFKTRIYTDIKATSSFIN